MIEKAIIEVINVDFREEALELIKLAPDYRLDELLNLYLDNNFNSFCSCLDIIKYDLYKDGKITKDDFPNFGEPFITFDNEKS